MMRVKSFFYFSTFILLLARCATPESLTEEALQAYIQDQSNGLMKVRQAAATQMKVFYRPNDFLIWQEVEGETDTTRIREAFTRYDDYLYFMMQLSVDEKDALYGLSKNQMEFNDRLQTLSFRMNQYVQLTTSNSDTIPVADAYYSRMFGLSKSNDLLFVFNKKKAKDAEWVSFHTKDFGFKTGRQSFRFNMKDIEATPKLKELENYQ